MFTNPVLGEIITAVIDNAIGLFGAVIAIFAFFISLKAIKLSKEANKISSSAKEEPYLEIVSLGLNLKEVKVFGGKDAVLAGKKRLKQDQIDKIRKNVRSDSIEEFEGDTYFFVNLCDDNTKTTDMMLVLNALDMKFVNLGRPVINMTVYKVYSMISDTKSFPLDMKLNVSTPIIQDGLYFKSKVAYACPHQENSSLNLAHIATLARRIDSFFRKPINLKETPKQAGKIISFWETAYLLSFEANNHRKYWYTMFIERAQNNLRNCYLVEGEEKFDELENKVIERIKKSLHNSEANPKISIVSDDYISQKQNNLNIMPKGSDMEGN